MVGFNLVVLTGHLVIDDYRRQLQLHARHDNHPGGGEVRPARECAAVPAEVRWGAPDRADPVQNAGLLHCGPDRPAHRGGGGVLGRRRQPVRDVPHIWEEFAWRRFAAVQIWIFVLFLVYTTAAELSELFGHGELRRLFFERSASDLKLMRRQTSSATSPSSAPRARPPSSTPPGTGCTERFIRTLKGKLLAGLDFGAVRSCAGRCSPREPKTRLGSSSGRAPPRPGRGGSRRRCARWRSRAVGRKRAARCGRRRRRCRGGPPQCAPLQCPSGTSRRVRGDRGARLPYQLKEIRPARAW